VLTWVFKLSIGGNRPRDHTDLPRDHTDLPRDHTDLKVLSSILMTPRFAPTLLILTGLSFAQTAPAPNARELTKYILGVDDLNRSYAFYHGLGLEFQNPNGQLGDPAALAEPLLKLVDVPKGTKFRNMMLKIPNAPFALEVTEFTATELHPVEPYIQDPGASLFTLLVSDLDAAMKVAKRLGGEIATVGGAPVPGPNGRTVVVKDPDGYYVQIQQASAPGGARIAGAQFASVVQDAEKAAAFYRDKLGFKTQINEWTSTFGPTAGVGKAEFRTVDATIPGTQVTWRFAEFRGVNRKPYTPKIPDPGAPAVGLQVRDLDSAVAAVKAAGGAVITQGGSVALGNGKVAFIRDPSGILVELAQPK
jgi:catechol 2,3-dioxygenase-like lactoylglutathione lyase family enzyme